MSIYQVPETENGIDLDDPIVVLFRRLCLEKLAKEQGENARCPKCNMLLPSTTMTWTKNAKGELKRFCTICEIEY